MNQDPNNQQQNNNFYPPSGSPNPQPTPMPNFGAGPQLMTSQQVTTPQFTPTTPQPLNTPPIYPNNQQPVNNIPSGYLQESTKDYMSNLLFAVFLGNFGIDRFYLGKSGTGVIKLLTLGGLGVWSLIDVILGATGKTKDKQGLPLKGANKNKNTGLIVLIVYIICFIGFTFTNLMVVQKYIITLSDYSSINSIKNLYLLSAKQDDITPLKNYYDSSLPGVTEYIQSTFAKNDGMCEKIEQSKIITMPNIDAKQALVILDCPTSTQKYWKLEMQENKNDRWLLINITSSDVPFDEIEPVSDKNSDSPTLSDANNQKLACLTPQDAAYFGDFVPTNVYTYFVADSVFFNADSTSYAYNDVTQKIYQKFGEFAKANNDSAYTVQLVGATKELAVTSEGAKLANDRATLVQAELIKAGVPAERITIVNDPSRTNDSGSWSRNVDIEIKADPNCI
jgi:TM2 domain-containing membrane protein YozV/outer membrane protein OmpA-like peptidoglycan-associated protein